MKHNKIQLMKWANACPPTLKYCCPAFSSWLIISKHLTFLLDVTFFWQRKLTDRLFMLISWQRVFSDFFFLTEKVDVFRFLWTLVHNASFCSKSWDPHGSQGWGGHGPPQNFENFENIYTIILIFSKFSLQK